MWQEEAAASGEWLPSQGRPDPSRGWAGATAPTSVYCEALKLHLRAAPLIHPIKQADYDSLLQSAAAALPPGSAAAGPAAAAEAAEQQAYEAHAGGSGEGAAAAAIIRVSACTCTTQPFRCPPAAVGIPPHQTLLPPSQVLGDQESFRPPQRRSESPLEAQAKSCWAAVEVTLNVRP